MQWLAVSYKLFICQRKLEIMYNASIKSDTPYVVITLKDYWRDIYSVLTQGSKKKPNQLSSSPFTLKKSPLNMTRPKPPSHIWHVGNYINPVHIL